MLVSTSNVREKQDLLKFKGGVLFLFLSLLIIRSLGVKGFHSVWWYKILLSGFACFSLLATILARGD